MKNWEVLICYLKYYDQYYVESVECSLTTLDIVLRLYIVSQKGG